MDQVFPFGLSGATAWYATLYVLTFALHQALVHYVLAGSLVVAWAAIFPGRENVPRLRQPVAATLRDWMPFMLSAAITAGVAPLLFVQILYPQQFYTANLLLAWRWMIVIPVLVVVFYLLYLIKTDAFTRWPRWAQAAIAALTGIGIVFVGFCWTANYLLSVDEAQWPEIYATGALPLGPFTVMRRMLVWLGGSFVSLTVVVGWQLGAGRDAGPTDSTTDSGARLLGWLALTGLDVFLVGGVAALWWADAPVRQLLLGVAGWPYLVVLAVGLALLYFAWFATWWGRRLTRWRILAATIGWVLSLVSVSALREMGRIARFNLADLASRHAEATQVGGLGVFLAFAVINGAAIAWCVWLVRRRRERDL